MYNDFGQNNVAPVRVGEELDVKIEALGEKGDGIAKKNGFVLFVPNVKEGEVVKIKVNRVLKKVGFAEKIGEGSLSSEDAAPEPQADAPVEEAEPEEEIEISEEEMANDSEDFGEEDSEETAEEDEEKKE